VDVRGNREIASITGECFGGSVVEKNWGNKKSESKG
jgi:hypothetical protein